MKEQLGIKLKIDGVEAHLRDSEFGSEFYEDSKTLEIRFSDKRLIKRMLIGDDEQEIIPNYIEIELYDIYSGLIRRQLVYSTKGLEMKRRIKIADTILKRQYHIETISDMRFF